MSGEVSGDSGSAASRIFRAFQTCQPKKQPTVTIYVRAAFESMSQETESRFLFVHNLELMLGLQRQLWLKLELLFSCHLLLGRHAVRANATAIACLAME